MQKMPRDTHLDATLAMLSDGYEFIDKRCARLGADVFQTRLLLQETICMRGKDAARVFYNTDRFRRGDAAPRRLKKTLFGTGGVQGLDDDMHRCRKAMFMALMGPDEIDRITQIASNQWRAYAQRWEGVGRVVLFDEVAKLLCRVVCAWAGVPLPESEVELRTHEMNDVIEASAKVGPRHWLGRLSRGAAERWAANLVEGMRAGKLDAPDQSALCRIALHRDADGELLDGHEAAVELLNVLRPTVAVARYVVFAALALHKHPAGREALEGGDDESLENFVQEVRRYYPFFPFVAARVRQTFTWRGYRFEEGTRTLLDLYATNHDERLWDNPHEFRPRRFRDWGESAYDLIPQGGGDTHRNHRCPGERITIELTKMAAAFLHEQMDYDVPDQNLAIDMSRIPAIPESRFVIDNIRLR